MNNFNPFVQEVLDQATDGLDVMEAARLRTIIIQRLKEATVCNIITPRTVIEIALEVLDDDIAHLERRLEELHEATT